jgi:hypothetical protein
MSNVPGGAEPSGVTVSPQPHSACRSPSGPMARLVPPTPVAHASEVGYGTIAGWSVPELPSP